MPTLRELQSHFRAALLDGDGRAAVAAVHDGDLGAPARLAVYRHHVVTSLTATLESTYPVVARLVDPRFFRYAADRFIRAHPPTGPCLFEYGAGLADFLAGFEPSRHLAYLPDVARLEWAMNVALHAPDVSLLDPEALRFPTAIALHPSLTLLASPWPIDTIWYANQPDASEQAVDLDAGQVRLQVWRAGDDVVFRRLAVGAYAFREALGRTGAVELAAGAALATDPALDLARVVRDLLDDEVLIARQPR
jgi:hypothetical protein